MCSLSTWALPHSVAFEGSMGFAVLVSLAVGYGTGPGLAGAPTLGLPGTRPRDPWGDGRVSRAGRQVFRLRLRQTPAL